MRKKSEYQYSVKLRDKKIKFRKWKVKDKKNFLQALQDTDEVGLENLVYDCLEDKTLALSEEEYKYVLMSIRRESIGKTLKFTINCNSCHKDYEYENDILKLNVPNFKNFGTISYKDVEFEMGDIQNKEYYLDAIRQCQTPGEKSFIDFLFHVRLLNGSDTFDFDSLYDYVNNLDIEIGENLFLQWNEMKLTFDKVQQTKCTHCGHKEYVQFDDLDDFFPRSWFE